MEVFVNCLRHSHSAGLDIYDATVSTVSLLVLNFSEDFTFVEENKDCVWGHLTANRRVILTTDIFLKLRRNEMKL